MKASDKRLGVLWIVLYVLFAIAPLAFMLVGERPMGRDLIREISVALGFTGIGLMALQFVLTARIAAIEAPYGSDIVYFFHHKISFITLALWLAHPLILIYAFGWNWGLLNIFTGAWRQKWGIMAVVALLVLVGWSVLRRRLQSDYVRWRIWHGVLAALAMLAVMVHAYMVGRYIGTPAKQAFWVVYGLVALGLVLYLRVYKPIQMLRKPYRVAEVRPELGETYSLVLEPVGHAGMRFEPGQFAWLTAHRSPLTAHEHPFSFSSSSERPERIEFGIKELGDFSSTIRDLKAGDPVYIDGPYGAFSPDRHEDDDQLVFVAGGVGITPIMSMLRSMADRGDTRPAVLLYGSYSLDWATFRDELTALEGQLNLRVIHVLEHPQEGWTGETGYVTRDLLARNLPPEGTRYCVYVCGPTPMLNAVERALHALGIPPARIVMERFDLA